MDEAFSQSVSAVIGPDSQGRSTAEEGSRLGVQQLRWTSRVSSKDATGTKNCSQEYDDPGVPSTPPAEPVAIHRAALADA